MNRVDVEVSFYLKRSEADTDGDYPIMAKLNVGKYSEVTPSVKIEIPQSRWSSGRVSGKSVATKEANDRLDEICTMTLNIYIGQSVTCDGMTAKEVEGILLGMASGQETLLGCFRRFIRNFEKRVEINRTVGGLRAYSNAYSHIERFLQAQYKLLDVPFSALDHSFIDKYDLYFRTERNLAPRTIIDLIAQLGTIVGKAIANGIITASPFMDYEPIHPKHVQKYPVAEELHRTMTIPLRRQALYHVRDTFLFPCFTGISYGDIRLLAEDDPYLAEDGIRQVKSVGQGTKIEFEIPFLDLPLQILKKYSGMAPGDKLLPMYCNSALSLYLKEIARICHTDRPLVFHAGRHTYTTEIALSHGVPLETVSRMLDHSQIETIQIYVKVTNEKIDTDTKASNRKILERFSVVI